MCLSSLGFQRPELSVWEPSGFFPDPWLALLNSLLDSCREKRRENPEAGRGSHAAAPELGPRKFEPSHRLQAGRRGPLGCPTLGKAPPMFPPPLPMGCLGWQEQGVSKPVNSPWERNSRGSGAADS